MEKKITGYILDKDVDLVQPLHNTQSDKNYPDLIFFLKKWQLL